MTKSNLLTLWIFVALVIGVITGVCLYNNYPTNLDGTANVALSKILDNITILTDVFLRLIKMIIAPLVFSLLLTGISYIPRSPCLKLLIAPPLNDVPYRIQSHAYI